MKKIFKYILPCMALGLVLTSCYDEVDDKSTIDNKYFKSSANSVAFTSADVIDYQSIALAATVADTIDMKEVGFQVATSADFKDCASVVATRDKNAFSASVAGLEGETKYFARAYVVAQNGNTILSSEVKELTTPRVPIYTVNNTFLVHELEYDSDNEEWVPQLDDEGNDVGYYLINIEFAEGSDTDVIITGFCGFSDAVVAGTWDAESSTITLEAPQAVGEHARYGTMFFRGLNDGITGYTNTVVLKFTPLGGLISSSNYTLSVQAGNFGYYRFDGAVYTEE